MPKLSDDFTTPRTSAIKRWIFRLGLIFVFCVLIVLLVFKFGGTQPTADVYADGTPAPIAESLIYISTGNISDDGEMRGNLVLFYVTGKEEIKNIRFSCKNQFMEFNDFSDDKDKLPSLGMQKQFTIPYDKRKNAEAHSMTVQWTPWDTITTLTENHNILISDLPPELSEDLIVLEITFSDGSTAAKAIHIKLNSGNIAVALSDYVVTDKDEFITNPRFYVPEIPDIIPDDTDVIKGTPYTSDDVSLARDAAQKYYTEFFKIPMNIDLLKLDPDNSFLSGGKSAEYSAENKIAFLAYTAARIDTPRNIVLVRDNGNAEWEVVNEGY